MTINLGQKRAGLGRTAQTAITPRNKHASDSQYSKRFLEKSRHASGKVL